MNTITARCGHSVPAVGTPGSMARRAAESRTCDAPRCRSRLPAKFTDAECEAYCRLQDRQIRGWLVDMLTKRVTCFPEGNPPVEFSSLVTFEAAR